jgi:hypothetical protein
MKTCNKKKNPTHPATWKNIPKNFQNLFRIYCFKRIESKSRKKSSNVKGGVTIVLSATFSTNKNKIQT